MATETLTDFDQQYLETWTEPDAERRRASIERLWAPDGRLEISPAGLTLEGTDAIAEHVGRVHEQNIAGRGMRFQYDQHAEAGDALLLRWSMLAPDGSVVGRGVDLVFRGPDGRVQTLYMFMGIS
jgi:hypothetical protein